VPLDATVLLVGHFLKRNSMYRILCRVGRFKSRFLVYRKSLIWITAAC